MERSWARRKFLSRAAVSAASLASAPPGRSVMAYGVGKSALQSRLVTHVSVERVNQMLPAHFVAVPRVHFCVVRTSIAISRSKAFS